jgi:hypothetical protein
MEKMEVNTYVSKMKAYDFSRAVATREFVTMRIAAGRATLLQHCANNLENFSTESNDGCCGCCLEDATGKR